MRPDQPVVFETDNADIIMFMKPGADGSITMTYEVRPKVPMLKTCQRN